MSRTVIFLTVDQLIAIHARMIDEFGGEGGVRDRGLLESAAAMPAARFGGQYLHRGIPAKAAAYFFHLSRNHPFLDGNKRTAVVAAEVFLRLNGFALSATNDEVERLALGVADSTLSKDQAVKFFRAHAGR